MMTKMERKLYKLMNYAIYGKVTENLRNRINWMNQSVLHEIFDNNLVTIYKSKFALKLNKPAYIEMCFLELSKVLMYEFYFDYIKNKYDNKPNLLFTNSWFNVWN